MFNTTEFGTDGITSALGVCVSPAMVKRTLLLSILVNLTCLIPGAGLVLVKPFSIAGAKVASRISITKSLPSGKISGINLFPLVVKITSSPLSVRSTFTTVMEVRLFCVNKSFAEIETL